MALDPITLVLVALIFVLAGTVKGTIGLGLPTISIALLTLAIGLKPAMAVILIPSFLANIWQAFGGGNGRAILARIWPFLLTATLTVWIGALALTRVDVALLSALLGALLIVYALVGLWRPPVVMTARRQIWAGPILGCVNGILTGMTGSFVVPGVLYLQAAGLPRDMLIQAMGMLFLASTVALAVALGGHDLLTGELAAVSLAAVVPALAGMALGRRLREGLSEATFRRVFFAALLALGAAIVVRSAAA